MKCPWNCCLYIQCNLDISVMSKQKYWVLVSCLYTTLIMPHSYSMFKVFTFVKRAPHLCTLVLFNSLFPGLFWKSIKMQIPVSAYWKLSRHFRFYLVKDKFLLILHGQYCGCRWCGDTMSQCISRLDSDLDCLDCSIACWGRVNYQDIMF